jgi:hypothetical protein
VREIREWLEKGQDYAQGVALYERHGKSRVVLTALRRGISDFARQKLREELSKLIQGVTPPTPARVRVVDTSAKRVDKTPERVHVAPAVPSELVKVDKPSDEALRLQRSSWYAERHRVHATLELLATDAERRVAGERILTLSELLTASYQPAGEAPVVAPRPDLGAVTDEGEIRRLLANLRPLASKLKKNPARALDLQQARADIALLEKKLQHEGGIE